MGKCHRICCVCGKSYFGQGKYCCSIKCSNIYRTGNKIKMSDEHRKFLSESMSLKTKGKKLSDEHVIKISLASKLRWKNDEYRKNMHDAHMGREVTQETRDKIRHSQMGKKCPWVTEYNKNRIPPSGWHHSEASKKAISEKVSGKNNGQFGKLPPNVRKVRFIDINGIQHVFRSKWEEKFAKFLDDNNINWEYEKTTYLLSDGSTYTPDFFTENCIFEVKGFPHKRSIEKFELFKKDYPEFNIVLVDRFYFKNELQIKL